MSSTGLVYGLSISKIAQNVTQDSNCGDGLWGNPTNMNFSRTVNGIPANSSVSLLTNPTACLVLYNYNFSIPAGATITGVQANVVAKASLNGQLEDSYATLYTDTAGSPIQSSCSNVANGVFLNTSYTTTIYGGDGFNWNCVTDTLDVTTINKDGFGFGISYQIGGTTTTKVSVDSINMTIYYNVSTGDACLGTASGSCSCGFNWTTNQQINATVNMTGTGISYITATANFTKGLKLNHGCTLAIKHSTGQFITVNNW